jgi:hypothetical protein
MKYAFAVLLLVASSSFAQSGFVRLRFFPNTSGTHFYSARPASEPCPHGDAVNTSGYTAAVMVDGVVHFCYSSTGSGGPWSSGTLVFLDDFQEANATGFGVTTEWESGGGSDPVVTYTFGGGGFIAVEFVSLYAVRESGGGGPIDLSPVTQAIDAQTAVAQATLDYLQNTMGPDLSQLSTYAQQIEENTRDGLFFDETTPYLEVVANQLSELRLFLGTTSTDLLDDTGALVENTGEIGLTLDAIADLLAPEVPTVPLDAVGDAAAFDFGVDTAGQLALPADAPFETLEGPTVQSFDGYFDWSVDFTILGYRHDYTFTANLWQYRTFFDLVNALLLGASTLAASAMVWEELRRT